MFYLLNFVYILFCILYLLLIFIHFCMCGYILLSCKLISYIMSLQTYNIAYASNRNQVKDRNFDVWRGNKIYFWNFHYLYFKKNRNSETTFSKCHLKLQLFNWMMHFSVVSVRKDYICQIVVARKPARNALRKNNDIASLYKVKYSQF